MKILIAGGGTGGHIYPALAIAAALKKETQASVQVEFVGTASGLESQIVPRSGYKIHTLNIGRLNRNIGLVERIKTILQLPFAFFTAAKILIQFQPDAVIGVGGYVSGPLLFVASLLRFRTFIWEPNAYPGLANRLLSYFVKTCLVVFEDAKKHMHGGDMRQVHMPIRKEIEELALLKNSGAHSKFQILVFGGSQGARAINNCMVQMIEKYSTELADVQFVHQTGPVDFERVKSEYHQSSQNLVSVHDYLHDMPAKLNWADLVIARSGTGTLSELAASGRAAILIPLPTAADDHQTQNAKVLVRSEAARLLPQNELTPERLFNEIMRLKNNPHVVQGLASKVRGFHKPKAAEEIANLVIKSVKG